MGSDRNGCERPRRSAPEWPRGRHHAHRAHLFPGLEEKGYKSLANTSDYDDIYAPTVYLYVVACFAASDPKLPELLIKVHAEAIKRFYEDKAFAIKAYLAYNKNDDPADIARVYDHYARTNTFERVPYLNAAAVRYMIDHPVDAQSAAQKKFDFSYGDRQRRRRPAGARRILREALRPPHQGRRGSPGQDCFPVATHCYIRPLKKRLIPSALDNVG